MKPSPISWTLATLTPSRAIRPLRCLSALLKQQTSNSGHRCGEQRRVPGSVGEATDTAWISIAELPNADLLIVQQGIPALVSAIITGHSRSASGGSTYSACSPPMNRTTTARANPSTAVLQRDSTSVSLGDMAPPEAAGTLPNCNGRYGFMLLRIPTPPIQKRRFVRPSSNFTNKGNYNADRNSKCRLLCGSPMRTG